MLVTFYKIGGVHFRMLCTNGFHVKAKIERFTAASTCCCQKLKYENFTSSFARLCQSIAPKSVPHVQHDYFSSFNQSNHLICGVVVDGCLPFTKKFPNAVGMYMVRLFWCSRPENFQNFRNVLKGSPKFPTGISEQKIC